MRYEIWTTETKWAEREEKQSSCIAITLFTMSTTHFSITFCFRSFSWIQNGYSKVIESKNKPRCSAAVVLKSVGLEWYHWLSIEIDWPAGWLPVNGSPYWSIGLCNPRLWPLVFQSNWFVCFGTGKHRTTFDPLRLWFPWPFCRPLGRFFLCPLRPWTIEQPGLLCAPWASLYFVALQNLRKW